MIIQLRRSVDNAFGMVLTALKLRDGQPEKSVAYLGIFEAWLVFVLSFCALCAIHAIQLLSKRSLLGFSSCNNKKLS